MKKIWGWIIGVVIIVVLVFYIASSNSSAPTATTTPGNTTPTPNTTSTDTPSDTTTTTAAAGGYKDGIYTGAVANAVYGQLQLSVTINNGKITDITWPVYPNTPGHTSQVSASALPTLEQEAIVAQSANVNIVSGATQDSQAFQQSLASALTQAQS